MSIIKMKVIQLVGELPIKSVQIMSMINEYLNIEYRKYYIQSDRDPEEWDEEDDFLEGSEYLSAYVVDNHPEIVEKSRHGDFIEDGKLSGIRSRGLYIIYKKKNNFDIIKLESIHGKFGSIPKYDFVGFRDIIPGFQIYLNEDYECFSGFNKEYCPIDLDFLRRQKIEDFSFTSLVKYSSFIYEGRKILVLYPYCYSLESNLKEDYFLFYSNGFEEYILKGFHFQTQVWDEDDKKNQIYSKIDEYSTKFDIVLAPFINDYDDESDDDESDDDE